jgi:hypothetical protein
VEGKGILSRIFLLLVFPFVWGTVAAFSEPQGTPPSELTLPVIGPSPQQSAGSPATTASPIIAQVDVNRQGQKTIVRIIATGPTVSQAWRLRSPERLVLDFPGAHLAVQHWPISNAVPPVLNVRVGQFKPDVARVVIDLDQASPYRVRTQENTVTVEFDVPTSTLPQSPALPVAPAVKSQHVPPTRGREVKALSAGTIADAPRSTETAPATKEAAAVANHESTDPDSAPFETSFQNGMLTFRAHNQALRSLVMGIGTQARIAINMGESLGNEQISVEFRHYRVDEALRQMLKDYDVSFLYAGGGERSNSLKEVWVYPMGDLLPEN